MPLSNYDTYFGGKKGSAEQAYLKMLQEYGSKKGKEVFYSTVNKRKG
jgi:hypothetical protein